MLLITPFFLFSCEKNNTVKTRTEIPFTFSVIIDESSIVDAESEDSIYSFMTVKTYSLNDNEDLKDYLGRLNNIVNKGGFFIFNGLENGQVITPLAMCSYQQAWAKCQLTGLIKTIV